MSPRRRKAEDVDVFAALVRVMLRCGPAELTLRAWTLYREGSAAERLRDDLEATLRPYLARGVKRRR